MLQSFLVLVLIYFPLLVHDFILICPLAYYVYLSSSNGIAKPNPMGACVAMAASLTAACLHCLGIPLVSLCNVPRSGLTYCNRIRCKNVHCCCIPVRRPLTCSRNWGGRAAELRHSYWAVVWLWDHQLKTKHFFILLIQALNKHWKPWSKRLRTGHFCTFSVLKGWELCKIGHCFISNATTNQHMGIP